MVSVLNVGFLSYLPGSLLLKLLSFTLQLSVSMAKSWIPQTVKHIKANMTTSTITAKQILIHVVQHDDVFVRFPAWVASLLLSSLSLRGQHKPNKHKPMKNMTNRKLTSWDKFKKKQFFFPLKKPAPLKQKNWVKWNYFDLTNKYPVNLPTFKSELLRLSPAVGPGPRG